MWKDFKIRTKMLISFGLIFAVFGISILVTWSYLNDIRRENEYITNIVIPAQVLCTNINDSAYELFLAMRTFQLYETQENAAVARQWVANIQSTMRDIQTLHATAPELSSLAHQINEVFPRLRNYFDTIERSFTSIFAKNEMYESLSDLSGELSSKAVGTKRALVNSALAEAEMGVTTALYLRNINSISGAANIARSIDEVLHKIMAAVVRRDASALAELLEVATRNVESDIHALRGKVTAAEHHRMIDELLSGMQRYQELAREFVVKVGELEEIMQTLLVLTEAVSREITNSISLTQDLVMTLSRGSLQDVHRSITVMVSSAILAVLFGVAIAFFISRSIAAPLAMIVSLAKRAGDGDLTIEAEDFRYEGKDELGNMVDAISAMIMSQDSTVKQVIVVSDEFTTGASSLSSIAEETNASMTEVKGMIDQVASLSEGNGLALEGCNAGVEELSAGADTVAQSATDSAAFIAQTTEASNRAIQTVDSVINGMRDVDKNAKESENKIKQLVASVENVSSFVSVITGIADQTNLLALNAAIEAARAGEVGRGFAVVAEEVRKLAEESARAAQNVNNIIVNLQNGAEQSIKATTEAGRMLGDTLVRAEQAQSELSCALKEMNNANDSIQNIAAVAEEQAASCKEVAFAIEKATKSTKEVVETVTVIRRVTDETVKSVNGVTGQAESMNEHAVSLTEVLSRFKLSGATETQGKQKTKPKPKAVRG